MSELAVMIQQDLEKKLDRLCFIHNHPTLCVADEFYELRNTIDIETEELLVRLRDAKYSDEAEEVVQANQTRVEFIRILRELEEKCMAQLPKSDTIDSKDLYGHFRQSIDSLKTISDDCLKKAYIQLALELIEATYQLEKRLFGEETVFYVSSLDKNQIGHLIYISDERLRRHEIETIRDANIYEKKLATVYLEKYRKSFLFDYCLGLSVDKKYIILSRLVSFLQASPSAVLPKFIYMGANESNYAGYSAEKYGIDKQFFSYRYPEHLVSLQFNKIAGISSSLDLLELMTAKECYITVTESRLENLGFLVPSSVHRLTRLVLVKVHFDVFNGDLIGKCVNLRELELNLVDSGASYTSLEFLRPLKQLRCLAFSLQDCDIDISVLKELKKLVGLVFFGAQNREIEKKRPLLNMSMVLSHLYGLPSLTILSFVSFDVDSIRERAFADFPSLKIIALIDSKIGSVHQDAFLTHSNEAIFNILLLN